MNNQPAVHINGCPLESSAADATGGPVDDRGVPSYEIRDYDRMKPFLMTVAGSSNHWMYLSSTGGLTCGRRSPDHALFPYYTDDKIHDAAHTTGPFTAFRVFAGSDGADGAGTSVEATRRPAVSCSLWMPFSERYEGLYRISRRLVKSFAGDRVTFEERNHTLGLRFRYTWRFSRRFGFVRHAELENITDEPRRVELLDGLRNLLPAGVDRSTQERASTLVDAYKVSELLPESGLAVYAMSSLITDRAEPSEALSATVAWSAGLDDATVLLSEEQVSAFLSSGLIDVVWRGESAMRGRRGAYLLATGVNLAPAERHDWLIVADTDRDTAATADLDLFLAQTSNAAERMEPVFRDVEEGEDELARLVAAADGRQHSADTLTDARHHSNVLFNIMRGGVFADGYAIHRDDLLAFLRTRNRDVVARHLAMLEALPDRLNYDDLLAMAGDGAAHTRDPHLSRMIMEYLPLMFSRRHGDPSRPWNRFSIDVEQPDGSKRLSWQGNWRDIFQNWEALSYSFPRYLPAMIATFLNASTADGYNPYRISRDGIDWEIHDPDDPWSNIGYWGDHQIVYLWRLLERARRHEPTLLEGLLETPIFAFASVPYRIKSVEEILANPYESVTYDEAWADRVVERASVVGADGKLLHRDGEPYLVTLTEKLLITVLTKLSNYVPDGGIWMNTQRPEWNDANNALAGWGVSMVTLAYLRRFIVFILSLLPDSDDRATLLSCDVAQLLRDVNQAFQEIYRSDDALTARGRLATMTALGAAGSRYRRSVYDGHFGAATEEIALGEIRAALARALTEVDATVRTNRREDGLYHSYNILHVVDDGADVGRLPPMLEGQVAMLTSGLLDTDEEHELVHGLYAGPLYRKDARSFTLYPDKVLPSFLEKNRLTEEQVKRSPLLQVEAERDDGRIVRRDRSGRVRFNAAFRNARDLAAALDAIGVSDEKTTVLEIYEEVFHHREFTGRSGSFFKYEGLGSIYWHMVSKLNVAVLEAIQEGHDQLASAYRSIQDGIGVHKSPVEYGAFPFDPYSHTPAFVGVQQPGMTGQVKEDIIARFGELGVEVEDGCLRFRPRLLRRSQFLDTESRFRYLDLSGRWQVVAVPAQALAFTYCQVPVVYRLRGDHGIVVTFADGTTAEATTDGLPPEQTRQLSGRTAEIVRIDVHVPEDRLQDV